MGDFKASEVMDLLNEKGLLLSPDMQNLVESEQCFSHLKTFLENYSGDSVVIDRSIFEEFIGNYGILIGKSIKESQEEINAELKEKPEIPDANKITILDRSGFKVNIVTLYEKESEDRKIQDFVKLFNARFKMIEKLLSGREQISSRISVSRLKNKFDRETVSIIAMISDISYTKNGHIVLTVEDATGSFKVLITKNNPELFREASTLTLDEVIGIKGQTSKDMLFATEIFWPEVPILDLKKSPDDEYAIFLSDFHFGSKNFLPEEFNKFISWIRQETGTEGLREIAKKVKYIFIIGDLVDGVGIYPNQYNELEIKDIYAQYRECMDKIKLIPNDKAIIVCPGNHDALRLSEPQPAISKKLAPDLHEMNNVFMVSNPSIINIGKSDMFSGFNVLMYHGYSFDYYIANIEEIRNNGGYDNPELIMKYLLKRRHLGPTYGSTLYVPEAEFDPLVITEVPDIFATGHIHKSSIKNYRNITMICGSCWQSITSFQEKVGHHPEPCRVPIVHLKTRKMKILKFTKENA